VNFISHEDFLKIEKRSKVDNGDILMPMIGTIGNPIVVNKEREFAIKNVALIKFKKKEIINQFVKIILDSPLFLNYIENKSSGSTQKFLSLGMIREFKCPIPTLEEQIQLVERIEQEQALVNANKKLISIFEQKIKDRINAVWGVVD
jgi:restriction endonuclease S subunit